MTDNTLVIEDIPVVSPGEQAIQFRHEEQELVGILHSPTGKVTTGVVIVVGGPQTRIGSHRQFVLLARALASAGVAVLRFDYRGMGDSEGTSRTFEDINSDIGAAVDQLAHFYPGLSYLGLWGLCDAASAVLCYAHRDPRINRLMLLNPWVQRQHTQAQAMLSHYYLKRIVSRQFWQKLFSLKLNFRQAAGGFTNNLRQVAASSVSVRAEAPQHFVDAMLAGFERYEGNSLVILSGEDLTAAEFDGLCRSSGPWQKVMGSDAVTLRRLPEANHTFSSARWRQQVESWCVEWLKEN